MWSQDSNKRFMTSLELLPLGVVIRGCVMAAKPLLSKEEQLVVMT